MDYDKLDEILSTIDYKNKEYLSPIIDIIGQIKKCLIAEKTAYSHLMLREHYFGLVQKILEFENELMIKFSFNSLQRFLTDEVTCELCSTKEKSQFLANILRYIQHSHINNDITKLEIIRFLLNNHDTIEPILNPKILTSLIEISINEWQNDNKIIQSSSKALIIKYIAIVCNKISSYDKSNLQSQENPLDLLILCAFSSLLSVFNQEFRTNDLRVFALECLELLLNNLIQNKTFNICESQPFMEFSWQTLCPSILCQFGDIGLPSKALANHGLHFKLVYKILILMTALIGGCSLMIPVFEAIYQRVLLYTPEDDRLLILKLFKTHVNREFLESLVNPKDHNLKLSNVDVGNKSKGGEFNEFTIINLIIGFYRNSYEKSIKPPGDRMVQLLSSDCVSSFVQLVYNMYEEKEAEETPILLEANITFDHFIKYQISVLEDESHILETEADVFLGCLESWLSSLALKASNGEMNLDDEIKALCFDVIERSSDAFKDESIEQQQHEKKERFRKEFLLSKRKIYATIYMSIYLLFKSQPGLNETLHLSKFKFEQGNSRHCLYFIFRVMAHKDGDENHDFDRLFSEWLHCLYEKLQKFSVDKSDLFKSLVSKANILKQLKIVLEQIDCYSRAHQVHVKKSTKHCFVKSILKSSWIYLIDVLTGCLINIDLCDVEKILFYDQESQPSDNTKPELDVDNSDFSFVVFTLRSTLDSLFRLLKLVAGIDSMENELNQLFFILIDGNFFQSGLISSSSADELSLNKIICLDFVLYSSLSMVCDVTNLLESPKRSYYSGNYESNATVWKYLVDSAFYCLYLRNSLSDCCAQLDLIDPPDKLSKTANFFLKNKNLFKSVYANLNETIRDTTGQKTRLLSDSNLITSNEISLKIETIFTNIFYLIDNKKYYRQLSKSILIDQLAANVNDFLFNKLFAESNLLYLWNMSSTLCATSRRFLLNEKHLKQSYLTFNNLIIDMIEEFLGKLVEKLGLNLSHETIQNVSCLPNNELVFNLKPAKSSIYSIFFLEIWLHVYVVYFKSLFSRCGGLEKISKLAAKNKLAGKKLRNFSILDSIRSFNPVSNDKVVEQNTDVKFNRNNTLVDLYLFKKLICLIQKLFEIYTSRENGDFIETITSCMEIHNIQNGLIKTPSISSSNSSTTFIPIESDQQQQHDFNEPSQLIKQLEAYQTSLNDTTQQAERSRQISTCILYDSTLRLITPLPRFSSDLYRENLIDKFFSPNTFLLLPIKYLILNRKLDHSLKDETVNLISELVETSGSKLTTSWNFLFSCLRHLEFGGGSLEKSVQDKKRRAVKSRKSSSSSASPFSSSSSDNNSSDESDNANNSDNDLSTSSDEGKNLSFSPLSVRFSSIQTRMDSLVHIFNAYLNLASSSSLVLISGGVEFVKCVSTFIRNHHSTFKIEYNSENLFFEQFESHEANRERTGDSKEKELLEEIDDDSDLYMESNKSSGDQKSVTEVERLVELSKTQNPNSQIKPFLVCVQKMFRIILKHLTSLDISSKQSEVVQMNQLLIETNRFEVTLTEFIQAKKIPLAWLNEKINRLSFEAFGKHEFIEFEAIEDLAILHANFEDFLKHKDGLNLNKLIIYSVDSLCESVFCTHNELNSVEIVELINDIIIKLVDLNQFRLVGYLLIQIVIKKLDREIDYYELIRSKSMMIINNGNYTSNLFFVSQLFSHRINSLIAIIEKIIDVLPKEDEQNIVILNTILNRLFYIITKATIRKLDKFDSLIDLDFKFDNLFKKCFELGILSCKNVCINGIRTLYLLSLVPFNTLILNYQVGSDDNTIKYSNLEILTDECRNKWELSCVKKSFNWSKKLFSNEQFSDEPPPETSEVVETGNNRQPAQSDDEISINEESEENEGRMNKHKDEKNFYRNFTIKLSSSQSKNLFCNENPSGKHINLNCLISFLKFHSATLNVVTNCCCSKSNLTASILKLLGVTYLTSIKIDRLFSFKILLSKILYLNYESNLANFISLTKLAFSTIGELLCEFACEHGESIVVGESSSIDVIESELDSLLKNESFSLGKFFGLFISHFAKYYLYLNEKTHDFKLDDAYLKTLMDKYENDAGLSEIKREEVIELFRIHKEHNKTLTMKTLTKITQTTLSKSPSLALSEAEVSKEDNLNDLEYIRNDYRFRYQTWSFRMIRSFLNGLNDETSRSRGAIEKMPREARKCVAQVIVVFNSCSSYCHCSISAFNEELTDMGTSSKSDLKHVKDTSVNLLSSILNSLKRKD